jgi:hypothetical protein
MTVTARHTVFSSFITYTSHLNARSVAVLLRRSLPVFLCLVPSLARLLSSSACYSCSLYSISLSFPLLLFCCASSGLLATACPPSSATRCLTCRSAVLLSTRLLASAVACLLACLLARSLLPCSITRLSSLPHDARSSERACHQLDRSLKRRYNGYSLLAYVACSLVLLARQLLPIPPRSKQSSRFRPPACLHHLLPP